VNDVDYVEALVSSLEEIDEPPQSYRPLWKQSRASFTQCCGRVYRGRRGLGRPVMHEATEDDLEDDTQLKQSEPRST
jgi:hypothetical protein